MEAQEDNFLTLRFIFVKRSKSFLNPTFGYHTVWISVGVKLYLDIRGKGLLANYFNDFLKGNNLHRFANKPSICYLSDLIDVVFNIVSVTFITN